MQPSYPSIPTHRPPLPESTRPVLFSGPETAQSITSWEAWGGQKERAE